MSHIAADRVYETSATVGTGAYTLDGAVAGYQSFAAVGDGNTCWYSASNGTDWEVGLGTYTASGTTLARTTILASSNSDNAVNWGAGTKDVFLTQPAGRAVPWADTDGDTLSLAGSGGGTLLVGQGDAAVLENEEAGSFIGPMWENTIGSFGDLYVRARSNTSGSQIRLGHAHGGSWIDGLRLGKTEINADLSLNINNDAGLRTGGILTFHDFGETATSTIRRTTTQFIFDGNTGNFVAEDFGTVFFDLSGNFRIRDADAALIDILNVGPSGATLSTTLYLDGNTPEIRFDDPGISGYNTFINNNAVMQFSADPGNVDANSGIRFIVDGTTRLDITDTKISLDDDVYHETGHFMYLGGHDGSGTGRGVKVGAADASSLTASESGAFIGQSYDATYGYGDLYIKSRSNASSSVKFTHGTANNPVMTVGTSQITSHVDHTFEGGSLTIEGTAPTLVLHDTDDSNFRILNSGATVTLDCDTANEEDFSRLDIEIDGTRVARFQNTNFNFDCTGSMNFDIGGGFFVRDADAADAYLLEVTNTKTRVHGDLQFGTHNAIGGNTLSGYIEITDDGGTVRKLAVVS